MIDEILWCALVVLFYTGVCVCACVCVFMYKLIKWDLCKKTSPLCLTENKGFNQELLQSLCDDLVPDLDFISQKHLKAKRIVQTFTCSHLLLWVCYLSAAHPGCWKKIKMGIVSFYSSADVAVQDLSFNYIWFSSKLPQNVPNLSAPTLSRSNVSNSCWILKYFSTKLPAGFFLKFSFPTSFCLFSPLSVFQLIIFLNFILVFLVAIYHQTQVHNEASRD